MPPGARAGDVTAHGTPLTGGGSSDVLIGGLPAWRAGIDVHACPLSTGPVPHVGGTVATGSPTVLVNGHPAVRLGDVIVENGPPNTVASGAATVLIDEGGTSRSEGDASGSEGDASQSEGGTSRSDLDVPAPWALHPVDPAWVGSLYEQFSSYLDRYNRAVDGADLGVAGEQLTDERVNLRVTAEEGVAAFSFRTDGQTRIQSFQRGDRDDATLRMETDRATVTRITGADRPLQAFRTALVEDDITIRGIGTGNRLKWAVINVAEEIAEFLGLA